MSESAMTFGIKPKVAIEGTITRADGEVVPFSLDSVSDTELTPSQIIKLRKLEKRNKS